jgi:hypothetical protein
MLTSAPAADRRALVGELHAALRVRALLSGRAAAALGGARGAPPRQPLARGRARRQPRPADGDRYKTPLK